MCQHVWNKNRYTPALTGVLEGKREHTLEKYLSIATSLHCHSQRNGVPTGEVLSSLSVCSVSGTLCRHTAVRSVAWHAASDNSIANAALRDFRKVFLGFRATWFHGTRVNVISLTPLRKARPSLCRFSRKSQVVNSIMCRSLVPNFTKSGQQMWELRIEINPLKTKRICFI
jgi:hypothetical protein